MSNDVYKSSYEDQYDLPSPGNPGKAYRLQEGQPIASFFGYVCDGINPDGTWNLRDIDGKEGLSDADRTLSVMVAEFRLAYRTHLPIRTLTQLLPARYV